MELDDLDDWNHLAWVGAVGANWDGSGHNWSFALAKAWQATSDLEQTTACSWRRVHGTWSQQCSMELAPLH